MNEHADSADLDRAIAQARQQEKDAAWRRGLANATRDELVGEIEIQRSRADRNEQLLNSQRALADSLRAALDQERARANELQRSITAAQGALGKASAQALAKQVLSG